MPREKTHFTYDQIDVSVCAFSPYVSLQESSLLDKGVIAWVSGSPLILSLSPNSLEKAQQLITFAKTLKVFPSDFSLRLVFNQLDSVALEWDSIVKEHQSLIHLNEGNIGKASQMVHLITPCEPFFADMPPISPFKTVKEMLEKLPKLMNGEGWIDILAWYQSFLKRVFSRFFYDAVDAYTIEGYLKDFEHEVESLFLQGGRHHLLRLQRSLGFPENFVSKEQQERLAIEKELIVLRQELLSRVRDHYGVLKEIVRLIPVIEKVYPELVMVKKGGRLLKALLENQIEEVQVRSYDWGVMQMLLQLLEGELETISLIHQANDFHRTFLAFAIRAATVRLKEEFSQEKAFDLALHWEETVRHLNILVAKKGEAALFDSGLGEREKRVVAFRERVYAILQKCCVPLVETEVFPYAASPSLGSWTYPELFNYLPSFIGGNPLVEYDPSSGKPKEATSTGRAFLLSFCR